jgi:palmitoyltransferase
LLIPYAVAVSFVSLTLCLAFKFFVQFTTYGALYCAVVLIATAYALRRQVDQGVPLDAYILAAIVISAFFGLFSFLMTVTSMRYIILNMTNVDILEIDKKAYQLAVRVPRGTKSDKFGIVVYPLPKPEAHSAKSRIGVNDTIPNAHEQQAGAIPAASRDDLATRTFAILHTDQGEKENPWDLGPWRNWQSVLGTNPLDWLLPIRHSPCANHENLESFYPMGRVLHEVRSRYGLPANPPSDDSTAIELRNLRSRRA